MSENPLWYFDRALEHVYKRLVTAFIHGVLRAGSLFLRAAVGTAL